MAYKPKLANLAKHIPPASRNRLTHSVYDALVRYGEIPVNDTYRYLQAYWKKQLFYASYGHQLRKFKGIHRGQRCFIIGNGPSINQQDLTRLKNEITFVVNWFALNEHYDEINPTYYCISTTAFFRDGSPELIESNQKLHRLLEDKTKSATKFLNCDVREYVEDHNILPGHEIYYLNHAYYMYVARYGISRDITREVHHGNTVIIDFCLHLALYMGFTEVYLLGCDCTVQYPAPDSPGSHFHPDNPEWNLFKKLEEGDNPQKHSDSWYDNVTRDYVTVKNAFESRGRRVYNAGAGGRLEVFERVDYDGLFA
ncbi:MAG: hypothetical protein C4555_01275 [Dehalococcoidia bacterium]|jgi:hypothetical protein|nr:MAG: hypothetical protein C4555_01275 [Dehalococcoidia bacterium]